MDIAALSMAMSSSSLSNQVGVCVMKMTMDTSKNLAMNMTSMMQENAQALERAAQPNLGRHIDFRA